MESFSGQAATNNTRPPANSAATGAPAITGTARVGETLTASTSGITDPDGLDNAVFTYQWLADGSDIDGATSTNYTLTAADEGKATKVRVSLQRRQRQCRDADQRVHEPGGGFPVHGYPG